MLYDLAVFGSGFAAYEVVRSAVAAGRSVIVLERGTADVSAENQALSAVPYRREPVMSGGVDFGARVPAGFDSLPRYVGLGGTSELWSGKWRRLDAVDLQRAHCGRRWPVTPEALGIYYDCTATEYGWPVWPSDCLDGHRRLLASYGLRVVEIFEQKPPVRLRDRWADLAAAGADVRCSAALRSARWDASGQEVLGVTIDGPGGTREVAARHYVIACGGVESVHVSHLLRVSDGSGSSNTVSEGRYGGYMDHPKAVIGRLVLERRQDVFAEFLRAWRERAQLLGLALPEEEVAERQMGNHTLFLWAGAQPGDPLQLVVNLEQFPEPGNFVSVEPPAVSWRMSRRTWDDYHAFVATMTPRLEAAFGPVRVWEAPRFRGASHPAGALPMSAAAGGLLDGDCRVRGRGNLFCVSAAGFPLAGSANPTMTVVALARRLAEHLHCRTGTER
jgi:choline dehydrogenase-like flavoprotein